MNGRMQAKTSASRTTHKPPEHTPTSIRRRWREMERRKLDDLKGKLEMEALKRPLLNTRFP